MELKRGAHIHLIGICGTAMASLAGLLKDRGFKVTGSDSNPYPPMSTQLEALGIQIKKPYAVENLQPRPDFVIVGNVIPASNPEAVALRESGIPFTSLPKAIGDWVIETRACLNVSGTHGKTTTTALASWVWEKLGLQPGFLIGGVPKNFPFSFRNPTGSWFVIEGDEYDTAYFDKVPKFTHYRPRHVIFTSCEFDHADIYADMRAVESAFETLMKLVPREGSLVYWAGSETVSRIAQLCGAEKKLSYGLKSAKSFANRGSASADYLAQVHEVKDGRTDFEVDFRGKSIGHFLVKMSGDHNILNATSVIAMAHHLGFSMGQVGEALSTFQGVKRRQEILGEPGGVLVIEDFAHHPTAVRETIKGILAAYPGRKLFAIFEPRSATSRRKVFQQQYAEAFQGAAEVMIMKAFDQTKINEVDRFSSEDLVADLERGGQSAECFSSVDEIVARVKSKARKGDLVLIMSNGGFDGIYAKMLAALQV